MRSKIIAILIAATVSSTVGVGITAEATDVNPQIQPQVEGSSELAPEVVVWDYQLHPEDWAPTFRYYWGEILTPQLGRVMGPSGEETYYNLPMEGIINIMQSLGYNYPYWVREDGVKMYGDYIMVAADLSIRPRGTIVKTTRGLGIVCDTGGFVYYNPYQIDIATAW